MAQGTITFYSWMLNPLLGGSTLIRLTDGTLNYQPGGSVVWKVALLSQIPVDDNSPHVLQDYTEVSGSGYTPGGVTFSPAITKGAGFQVILNGTTNPAWTQNAAGPTDIRSGLIYQDGTGFSPSDWALAWIDMTVDGSTPISLADGDISITWNPSGIVRLF